MKRILLILSLVLLTGCHWRMPRIPLIQSKMEPITLAGRQGGFIYSRSGHPFHPWGNNYGNHGRLIEDYWETNWTTVAEDFQNLKKMGANVVRVHLQFSKFMQGPNQPNLDSIDRLHDLLKLAEKTGVYLDITGLGAYRKSDAPAWYDDLPDPERWTAQASFWEVIADACKHSPAVFCYDLMNEPMVSGDQRKARNWYTGEFGGFYFIQFINLEPPHASRAETAAEWTAKMTKAIHRHDKHHLITVGLLPWDKSMGELSGFQLRTIAPLLDFVSVHIYPEKDKEAEAVNGLKKFAIGKPLVIEETFPLTCSLTEEEDFLYDSRPYATGWMGHYNGETVAELQAKLSVSKDPAEEKWLEWEQLFTKLQPVMVNLPP